MQRLDGQLVLSPTDLTHHQECAHLTRLDLGVAAGEWAAPDVETPEDLQFVFDRGLAHEQKYLESLKAAGKSVVEIPGGSGAEGRRRAEAQTVEAMRRGVDVVYQGTFFDGAWGGQADFLLRVETPSVFGRWSYEIADTKLARKLKVAALLQMATYAERLTVLQGVAPEFIHVVTGDGESRPWRLIDVAAYARRARSRLETFVASPACHRSLTDRLLRPVPLGYALQRRATAGRRPRPRRADARRPARRAAGCRHRDSRGPGDGFTGGAEVVRHRRRRAHPAAAAGGRTAPGTDHGAAVPDAPRPGARPGPASPAAAERRRPLSRLRGRSLVRGRRGHRVPRGAGGPVRRVHRAVGARPAGRETDGRRPHRPAGAPRRRTRPCTSTTTRPTR